MTGTSLRSRLSRLFLLTGAVTVAVAVATVASLVALSQATRDRVDIYGPALLATETLAGAYGDQENGVRAFQVGGRPEFLQPYRAGRRAERRAISRLRTLLAGRPDLLAQLATVGTAGRRWRATTAEPAIARRQSFGQVPQTPGQADRANRSVARVRAALRVLDRALRAERDRAGSSLRRSQRTLDAVLALALLGLVALLLLSFGALRRWVTIPLERLGAEVDRVEAGDLSHAVVVEEAPAEITMLAGQVDRMRARVVANASLAERARAEAMAAQVLVEEQAEDLRRSNDELEQFAYVASHDLQEPLRKVASFCQLLERRYHGQLDERGEQYLAFAVDGAKRMQQLIQDLLTFSRVGRQSEGFRRSALEDVLAQALRQLDSALEEAGATVTHDPLPSIEGDPSLLVQLFQNLVGNAVKFRAEEAPRVHISALRSATEGVWEFACADNGIGIDEQYVDKIFVIFQRLHGRDAYAGTGIGLAMCKKIVEHHGGRLWLDTTTRDARGAVFRFTLPEHQAAPAAELAPAGETRKDLA